MFKFVEAVFASKHYLYNADTNTIYMDDKQMSYEEFDEEFFIIDIQDIKTHSNNTFIVPIFFHKFIKYSCAQYAGIANNAINK